MGATQVDICNMALDDVGSAHIIVISEQGKAATILRAKWQHVVDAVLADHNWSFALRWVFLALQGVKDDGSAEAPLAVYTYAYAKPVGYIRGIRLENEADKWEEVGEQIHTDVATAKMQYVRSQNDANKFPPLFVVALAKRLASEICVPLNQDKAKASALFDLYRLALDQAKLANAASQIQAKEADPVNPFADSRS